MKESTEISIMPKTHSVSALNLLSKNLKTLLDSILPNISTLELDKFELTAEELSALQAHIKSISFERLWTIRLNLASLRPEIITKLSDLINGLAISNTSSLFCLEICDSRLDPKGTNESIQMLASLIKLINHPKCRNLMLTKIPLNEIEFNTLKGFISTVANHKEKFNFSLCYCNMKTLDIKQLIEIKNILQSSKNHLPRNSFHLTISDFDSKPDTKGKTEQELIELYKKQAEIELVCHSMNNFINLREPIIPFPLPSKTYIQLFSSYIKEHPEKTHQFINLIKNCILPANEDREVLVEAMKKKTILNTLSSNQASVLDLNCLNFDAEEQLEFAKIIKDKFFNLSSISINLAQLTSKNIDWLVTSLNALRINLGAILIINNSKSEKGITEETVLFSRLFSALNNQQLRSIRIQDCELTINQLKDTLRSVLSNPMILMLEFRNIIKSSFNVQDIKELHAILKLNNRPEFNLITTNIKTPSLGKEDIESLSEEQRLQIAREKLDILRNEWTIPYISFIHFPLSIEQYKMLFAELGTFPNQQLKIIKLAQYCLLKPDEEGKRIAFIEEMLLNGIGKGEIRSLNMNELQLSNEHLSQIGKAYNENALKYLNSFLNIEVGISRLNSENLHLITDFINRIWANHNADLEIQLIIRSAFGKTKQLLDFLRGINNPKILRLGLGNNHLGVSDLEDFSLLLKMIQNPKMNYQHLSLTNNNLSFLQNRLLSIIGNLLNSPLLKSLDLTHNGLSTLDSKMLSEVSVLIDKKKEVTVQLLHEDEITSVQGQSIEQQLISAKLLLEHGFISDQKPAPFTFDETEYFKLLLNHTQKKNSSPTIDAWVKFHIKDYSLRLQLAKAKPKVIPMERRNLIEDYKLTSKDRLEIALSYIAENDDFSFAYFGLEGADLPAEPILSLYIALEDSLEENEDCETILHSFKETGLDDLAEICRELWQDNFYALCIKKLKEFDISDVYTAIKFFGMLQYFTFALILLTTQKPIRYPNNFGRLLKEIMDFAVPRMRYKLAEMLIKEIYSNEEAVNIHQAVLHNMSTTALLPSIPLTEILLSSERKTSLEHIGTDLKMQNEAFSAKYLLNEVRAILGSLPSAYKEGYYLKSFMGAAMELANFTKLNASQKLNMIKQKNLLRDKTELLLKQFGEFCQSKGKIDNENRKLNLTRSYEKLIELVGCPPALKDFVIKNHLDLLFDTKAQEKKRQTKLNNIKRRIEREFLNLKKDKNSIETETLVKRLSAYCDLQTPITFLERQEQLLKIYDSLTKTYGIPPTLKKFSFAKTLTELFDPRVQQEKVKQDLIQLKRRIFEAFNLSLSELELKEQISYYLLIQGLGPLGELHKLNSIEPEQMKITARKILFDLFHIDQTKIAFYHQAFGNVRNESALLTYFSKVQALTNDTVSKFYTQFVTHVLSENQRDFYQERYKNSASLHLSTVFAERKLLRELWMQNKEADLTAFITLYQVTLKKTEISYAGFLYNKIFEHKHIDPNKFPMLKKYLEAKNEKEKEDVKRILEEKCKDKTAKQKNEIKENLNSSELSQLALLEAALEYNLIELAEVSADLKDPAARKNLFQLLETISKAITRLYAGNEFLNNLEVLYMQLRKVVSPQKNQAFTGWKVKITDNYWDIFMCGTDIQGSCQSVEGNPELNKCLLGYVMDGKNKLVAVVNREGEIMARSILRILWDDTLKTPVLFMEEIYPQFTQGLLHAVLEKFAILEAERLHLTLLISEKATQAQKYTNKIQSLGSVAPWEYVDAIHHEVANGIFTIENSIVLYSPKEVVCHFFKASTPLKDNQIIETILDYSLSNTTEHEASLHFTWQAMQDRKALPEQALAELDKKLDQKHLKK
jgi:hypothetical protein